ncbi:UNVERIFIED_ORG: hypothetical protein ABIC48_005266 [Burkholderia territorii]
MGYPFAIAALGPLLFAQGRYVRRVTPRLPEAAGPRDGVAGGGPPLRVLAVGDSAAAACRAARGAESRERSRGPKAESRIVARMAPGPAQTPAPLAQLPHRLARFARRVCASRGAMPK